MKQTVIGIDPDSGKHGVAFYLDGELLWLDTWSLTDVVQWLEVHRSEGALWSIENVASNNSVHVNKAHKSKNAHAEIARRIGMCQQAQIELVRVLEAYGAPYVLQRPSKAWKDTGAQKKQFEKVTGWSSRSNADTRSAAYFGWLALKKVKKQ